MTGLWVTLNSSRRENAPRTVAGDSSLVRERFRVGWRGYPNLLRLHYNSNKVVTSRRQIEIACREREACS